MNTIKTATLTAPFLLALSFAADAKTPQTPASFGFSGDTVKQTLPHEQLPSPSNVAIYCQSDIATDGSNDTQCFEKSGLVTLEKGIEAAIEKQRFIPATEGGDAIAVRMNFRVIYQQDEDSQSVLLIPNLGSLQSTLGVNYSEPQEKLDSGWFDLFAKTNKSAASFFRHDTPPIRAKAIVNIDGKSRSVSMIDNTHRQQESALTSSLRKASFIPGFVDGKATEMGYLAIVTE